MAHINLPLYDDCRKWITRARRQNRSWENIKYAGKGSEAVLVTFLQQQIEDNFWPNLEAETWYKLVESEKEAEKRMVELSERQPAAILIDSSQDSEVTVPEDPRSSWQLYKTHLLASGWKKDAVEEIEKATIAILKRLNNDTIETGPIKGLVIGHVQSGKTANMAALMAMAADWGWNFFAVLSGTIENLRKQTQSRLLKDLNRPGNINWSGLEHLSKNSPMGQRAQDLRLEENSNMRYFTVCLKNGSRLKNMIEWMQYDTNKHKQMKIIIIDDEADQASVNTGDISNNERKKINSLIVNLVEGRTAKGGYSYSKAKAMNYISYTATPYANVLNEASEESLYPRNFIRTLQTSNEYFGPEQIFGIEGHENSDGLNIVRTISDEDLEIIKMVHNGEWFHLPNSFKESICWYFCAVSAMRIYGYKKPVSMLIHTSQKQAHHKGVSDSIQAWLKDEDNHNEILGLCREIWRRETNAFTKENFRQQYPEYGKSDNEIPDYPEYKQMISEVEILLEEISHIQLGDDDELKYHNGIHLCIDNCANNGVNDDNMFVRLAYPDPESKDYPKKAPAFIVVGGSTLSRGLTIEGLTSTYFLRSSGLGDSLMQMGRWFGYRKGYELLPRIWMTQKTIEKFEFLAELEVELREDLHKFMVAGADPTAYGPRVKNTPKVSWMRITSGNKMQGAVEVDLDFTGTSNQTVVFHNDKEILQNNITVTEDFLNNLGNGEISHNKNSFVWKSVSFEMIREQMLSRFIFHPRSRVFNQMEAFCEWVSKVSSEAELKPWNVVVSGIGKVNEPAMDGSHKEWKLSVGSINKITRSRKTNNGHATSDSINIGVLRAPKDLLADIDLDLLSEESRGIVEAGSIKDTDKYRAEAGCDKTPQLLIYRIDKDSKATSKDRADLNANEDLIGLSIYIPGIKRATNLARALTVKLPKEQQDDLGET
ncbi:endonuclease [Bacillus sp. LL01]|uniref:Z1 domain-containing protein n=1 Tax=Bacillus sp. LL01 TaxID=1665556 RepID=UPI00064CFA1A|nr:Z1 domain-containing protein [Bacillus sp. LL01]KMJ57115.1 endonuclease [Bacillus sp. LL01]